MLSISKPLGAAKVSSYYRSEYSSAASAYYSESATLRGDWYGRLASEFGLAGQQVQAEQFDRLAIGQHPQTGDVLIKPRPPAAEPEWVTKDAAWKEYIDGVYITALTSGRNVFEPAAIHKQRSTKIEARTEQPKSRSEREQKLIDMHALAAEVYRKNLAGNPTVQQYLASRNISPEVAAEFQLGFAGASSRLVEKLSVYGPELMKASGLFVKTARGKMIDRFRGRLMFPLQDGSGDVIAFAGRRIGGDEKSPKYVNSPATGIYSKGATLFNQHRAKEAAAGKGKVVAVEGYMDAIAAHSAGVPVVALGGTSMTSRQAATLRSLASTVVLNMDSDAAGTRATRAHLSTLLETGARPLVVQLPAKDAAEFIASEGGKVYRNAIREARGTVEWLSSQAAAEHDTTDLYGKIDAIRIVTGALAVTPAERRREVAIELAAHLGTEAPALPAERVEHRAGWDLAFSAPKSVSLAGLVGGDDRIIRAHREAVRVALDAAEQLIQARTGGYNAPETTAKFIAAAFDHDTARPVQGYAAAQLHTHCVVFNMTEDRNGQARSLQTHELYVAAPMLTAIYQNSLETQLRAAGYKIERGKNHAPEIAGFTPEYLASESLRSRQITEEVEAKGLAGQASRSIAAHAERESKLNIPPEQVRAMHRENAATHGNQPQRIVEEASNRRVKQIKPERAAEVARKAVDFARLKLSERNSVFDHHQVITEALRYSRGRTGLPEIDRELAAQKASAKFIEVRHIRPQAPLFRYTTPPLIENERYAIERVRAGRNSVRPIMHSIPDLPHLNDEQRRLVASVLSSRDQIMGVQGKAGTGKTTALQAMNDLARTAGFKTRGLGPTSKATAGLKEAGIDAETLQRFLISEPENDIRRLFFVDESSLASGKQMREFFERLGPEDRAVLVGDDRQHESVEAGRIFGELQESGMRTETLSRIMRQQEPGLLKAVEALSSGHINRGLDLLGNQGRITSIQHRGDRFEAIAHDYACSPEGTLVIAPDNVTRRELNAAIRAGLNTAGKLGEDVYTVHILVNRQTITGEDRAVAESYRIGDVVRYRKGSEVLKLAAKDYATVVGSDPETNMITVRKQDGKTVTYDPAKLRGVSIYEPEVRKFAVGDRIAFTAPSRELAVSNRDMGTVSHLDEKGNIRIAMDGGRTVGFNLKSNQHVDHAYAMTSHASQGATVDRVLVHIDTGDSRIRNLVTDTLAYVALSRPRFEARIYTDNEAQLKTALLKHTANATALSQEQIRAYRGNGVTA